MTTSTELKITGMTCSHCVKAVESALNEVEGVAAVQVQLESGTARVQGQTDVNDLLAAVRGEGYGAEVLA
ncbi:heavy metal transport/detoxification protein [Deinococcus irradiatisoli]|uniref:Heavy metal transport/detoxification protein n=1 Tax=Deinococcus irradiatisoli TaxID=2202254 RepID=A0A2Z3JKL9_9DEIO|nr:cation transporter [Deinococcus irradiatisoli]AWN21834.1 heavy metal transport/detoxification protein [Deinococcus irradiatisoli]